MTPFPGPAVAAIGDRLLGTIEPLADQLTEVIRAAEPIYDKGNVVPVADLRESVLDNLRYILNRLAGRGLPGLEAPRATGRRRAEQGAPLPAILHSYRVAGTFIWSAIVEDSRSHGGAAESLLPAAAELWSIIDELSGAVTDAYRDTVAERARSSAQTRNAMVDVLLRGDPSDGSRLWESTAMLRLPHSGTFVVVAAEPPHPGVEAVARVEESLRRHGIESVWRVEIDAHLGVVVITRRTGIDGLCAHLTELATGPVGVSATYAALDQTPSAVRQARLAAAAAQPGRAHVVRYEQVPIPILVASTPDAATSVARAVLGSVLALPAAECGVLMSTLAAWFDDEGATSATAERLHVHRNTVRYRLRRIEQLTGRSLIHPTGIAELHLALTAIRILRLQPRPSASGPDSAEPGARPPVGDPRTDRQVSRYGPEPPGGAV
jgi:hypothetical protein